MRRHIMLSVLALLAVLAMPGCDSLDESEFEPGPLGAVTLEQDEAIPIRLLATVTVAPTLGVVTRQAANLAVEDMGAIHGRQIELGGDSFDTRCSPEGGRAGALEIVADPQVAGVIGTNCSAAAVAASPVVSDAGLVMISPSNTSPRLTSDLAGNANADYHPGYFRTASNDLHQARALSDFVYNQLDLRRVATVHDGDPYTSALVAAFADAFSDLGGEVSAQAQIEKGATDMTGVLEEFATAGPDAIFFPLFFEEGSTFAEQAQTFEGLEETDPDFRGGAAGFCVSGDAAIGGDVLRRTGSGLWLQCQRGDGAERGAGARRVRGQGRRFSGVTLLGAYL